MRLAPADIDDRVRRYMADEPLREIAGVHGVTIAAICHTIRRHAPEVYGRKRGPRGDEMGSIDMRQPWRHNQ